MAYKLSIIVPQYKTESYIHKCVDSILSQTLVDFELILIDDGSPDRCGEICDEYASKERRVKVIHKENGGYSSAINAGLDIAQGEYIGIVDGDDYIKKDMYETLYDLAKEHDADVVECNFYVVKDNNIRLFDQGEKMHIGDNLHALEELIKWGWHAVLWNKIYKKELFSQLRLPDGKVFANDEYIIYRIFSSLKKYMYIGEGKYYYLKREGSVTSQRGHTLSKLHDLEMQEERFYYLKEKKICEPILSLAEVKYFNEIINFYRMLSIDKKLDPKKEFRKMVIKQVLANYEGFRRNNLLRKYRKWITMLKQNKTLFITIYNFYLNISNWYYDTKCKSIRFVKKRLSNQPF